MSGSKDDEKTKGAEGDTDRLAEAVAKEIRKTLAAQGWMKDIKE